MATTLLFPQAFFDAIAATLLAATNGSATVGAELQRLDVAVSSREPSTDPRLSNLDAAVSTRQPASYGGTLSP